MGWARHQDLKEMIGHRSPAWKSDRWEGSTIHSSNATDCSKQIRGSVAYFDASDVRDRPVTDPSTKGWVGEWTERTLSTFSCKEVLDDDVQMGSRVDQRAHMMIKSSQNQTRFHEESASNLAPYIQGGFALGRTSTNPSRKVCLRVPGNVTRFSYTK